MTNRARRTTGACFAMILLTVALMPGTAGSQQTGLPAADRAGLDLRQEIGSDGRTIDKYYDARGNLVVVEDPDAPASSTAPPAALGRALACPEVLDQACESLGSSTTQIQAIEPVGQEFTPTASTIAAVEGWLVDFNAPHSDTIVARIRDGSIGGTILGSVPLALTGGPEGWERWEFPTAVTVTPGNTYVLELDAGNASFGWKSCADDYPGGQRVAGGHPTSGDWSFRTFACAAEPVPASSTGVRWLLIATVLAMLSIMAWRRTRRRA